MLTLQLRTLWTCPWGITWCFAYWHYCPKLQTNVPFLKQPCQCWQTRALMMSMACEAFCIGLTECLCWAVELTFSSPVMSTCDIFNTHWDRQWPGRTKFYRKVLSHLGFVALCPQLPWGRCKTKLLCLGMGIARSAVWVQILQLPQARNSFYEKSEGKPQKKNVCFSLKSM